jgi:hypothetical protein
MTAFAIQLKAFADKTKRNSDLFVADVVTQVLTKLDARSPVGNPALWKHPAPKGYQPGSFRGNWQIGIDFAPAGETGRIDPTGEETLSTNAGSIPEEAAGHVFWIVNNVPYARPIEDGWSSQAPTGLVGLTAIEFQQYVDEAALKVAA